MFYFYDSGPLSESGNIPVGGRGEGRHRARTRGTGTRADGKEGCPGGSDLLELRANGPHQSLSSLNALKGEEMECAVYRSNTHLSVPQDRLRRAGVRANKLWLRGSKYCRTHISQY